MARCSFLTMEVGIKLFRIRSALDGAPGGINIAERSCYKFKIALRPAVEACTPGNLPLGQL
ncbi:MAG: hypothetical protein AB1473_09360 [Thermodesulfobacteriota bacterium]